MTVISESTLSLLRVLTMENESISVSVLPEVGAKILSLVDRCSGRNLLWQNPRIRPQRFPVDANFDNYWCGGWDDAFPTADPCVYQGEPYPNVGELRSLTWEVDQFEVNNAEATLQLSTWGPITPIRAVKIVSQMLARCQWTSYGAHIHALKLQRERVSSFRVVPDSYNRQIIPFWAPMANATLGLT